LLTLSTLLLSSTPETNGPRAIAASELLAETKLITTEDVLVELLNFFSEYGEKARRGAAAQAERILSSASVEVLPQSHETFMAALALYKARPDKGYSLTDCISMHAMRERGIVDVLTNDDHFRQEGFTALL
jgi:predicted nucleic acid-binding protein